jgi:hypothetical protein
MCNHLENLCQSIIEELVAWPSLMASLQSGRGEVNKLGLVERVLTTRLHEGQILLMEHCNVDYAFIRQNSVGDPNLRADLLIEFKFNYASQEGEFRKRINGHLKENGKWSPSAFQQISEYRKKFTHQTNDSPHAFVLYLTASPWATKLPENGEPRDGGFRHFSRSRQDAELVTNNRHTSVLGLIAEINLNNAPNETIALCNSSIQEYYIQGSSTGTYLACYLFKLIHAAPYIDKQQV